MDYIELMNGFAAKFAVEGLEIQDGTAALEIDGTAVVFIYDMEAGSVTLVADIGTPPPSADGPFGSMLLKANYMFDGTAGATLCQNPETGAYAICRSLPLFGLDADSLGSRVETLVSQAENWRGILSGCAAAEQEIAEKGTVSSAGSEVQGGFMNIGDFMQV